MKWPCSMKRTTVERMVLVALAIVASLATMECFLRLMPSVPGPSPLGDRSSSLYLPDEGHDHVCRPLRSTNSVRIAIIGDSFTLGSGVQTDDRYGSRLERLLNMRSGVPEVEVRVFALCGTSTFQQISLLDESLKWRPQIVILGICLNDTEDWGNPNELQRWRTPLRPQVPSAWIARPLRCSKVLTWIYGRIEQMVAHQNELRYYRRLYKPAYSGVAKFRDSIALMNDECRQAHAAFVPMIFPLLSEPLQKDRYPFEYAHNAIHRRCDELHVEYLDLLPRFRDASPDRLQVIPGFDPHPNEIAHRMAAESILLFLIDRHLLSPGYSPAISPGGQLLERIWHATIQRVKDPLSTGT